MKNYDEKFIEWLECYAIYAEDCDDNVINCIYNDYRDGLKKPLQDFLDYLIDKALDVDDMNSDEYTFIRDSYLNDEEKLTFFINNSDNVHYLTKEFMNNFDNYEMIESYEIIYDEFTVIWYYLP